MVSRPFHGVIFSILLLLCVSCGTSSPPTETLSDEVPVPPVSVALEPEEEIVEVLPPPPVEIITPCMVTRGSSAAVLLKPWLSSKEIYEIAKATKPVFNLTKIRVGKPFKVITVEKEFIRFEYTIDSDTYLSVCKTDSGYVAEIKPFTYDVEETLVSGQIASSFFEAVSSTGESSILAVRLGNLFGWEIDFVRDLRAGDSFSVLVEKRYSAGVFKGYGKILAAEFTNRGEVYDAFRMEAANGSVGYYSSEGKNLKHAFLKSPVAFTRVSSGYTLKRYHPILKRYKPHYGVDYAAPVGTPIYAIGSGTLRQVATNNSSGKHIFISHANGYQSGYLHMSRFAKGIRRGRKVTQGDLIGYVGQTGLATGPHLCFRMKQWGKPINPRKVKVPREQSVSDSEKEAFFALVARLKPLLNPRYAGTTPGSPANGSKG